MFHLKFQLSPKQPQTLWKLKKKLSLQKNLSQELQSKLKKKKDLRAE